MKTKRKKYIAILLGIALLGISLNSKQSPAFLTQTATAATTMVQLKHNAYV